MYLSFSPPACLPSRRESVGGGSELMSFHGPTRPGMLWARLFHSVEHAMRSIRTIHRVADSWYARALGLMA